MADLSNPCDSGCGENLTANRPPTGSDDSCSSSGLGYFCQGSIWTYDPTLPGANTGLNGDCPRAWINLGGGCNVAEWLEIAVPNLIRTETDPPTGTDCCQINTIWCLPPGTNGHTIGEVWIATGGCPIGTCSWCKICGFGTHIITSTTAAAGLPEGVRNDITFDTTVTNELGMVSLPGGFTLTRTGCYSIQAWGLFNYFGNNFASALLRLNLVVNGATVYNIGDVAYSTLNRPVGDLFTMVARGSETLCLSAGDTIALGHTFNQNFGGQTYDFVSAIFKLTELSER